MLKINRFNFMSVRCFISWEKGSNKLANRWTVTPSVYKHRYSRCQCGSAVSQNKCMEGQWCHFYADHINVNKLHTYILNTPKKNQNRVQIWFHNRSWYDSCTYHEHSFELQAVGHNFQKQFRPQSVNKYAGSMFNWPLSLQTPAFRTGDAHRVHCLNNHAAYAGKASGHRYCMNYSTHSLFIVNYAVAHLSLILHVTETENTENIQLN